MKKTHTIRFVIVAIFLVWLASCKPTSIPKRPEDSFHTSVYKSLKPGYAVSMVSDSELELSNSGNNFICKYSIKDKALRAVVTINGSSQAVYFDIVPEGLRDGQNEILYNEQAFEKMRLKERANQLLNNIRQIHMASQTLAMDRFTQGSNNTWPTESVTSMDELRRVLAQGNYLTSPEFDRLAEHIFIAHTKRGDISSTIFAVSDNFPGLNLKGQPEFDSDYVAIFMIGGGGKLFLKSELDDSLRQLKVPSLRPNFLEK